MEKTRGLFLCPNGGAKCQGNLNDHVLLPVVLSWLMDAFVLIMPKRKLHDMKNISEILKRGSVTGVRGKEYVTVTLQLIHYVKSAKERESWHQQLKSITSFLCLEEEHTMKATWWLFVLLVTQPSQQEMETVGHPGRGSRISTAFKRTTGVGLRAKSRGFKQGNNP